MVCRDGEFASRLRGQLNRPPRFEVEFVDPAEYAARQRTGRAADVIVLDSSVFAPDGFDFYRVLQHRSAAPPLVVLRARSDEGPHRVRWNASSGMEALETRLHMALGRSDERCTWLPVRYRGAHLQADLPGTTVTVDGSRVELSLKESALLGLLLSEPNRLVPRDVLIAELWGYETRSLDVYIRRLRKKLGGAGPQIETMKGVGYRFVEPVPRSATSARAMPATGPTASLHRVNSTVT